VKGPAFIDEVKQATRKANATIQGIDRGRYIQVRQQYAYALIVVFMRRTLVAPSSRVLAGGARVVTQPPIGVLYLPEPAFSAPSSIAFLCYASTGQRSESG
jgi:hypothetical protein